MERNVGFAVRQCCQLRDCVVWAAPLSPSLLLLLFSPQSPLAWILQWPLAGVFIFLNSLPLPVSPFSTPQFKVFSNPCVTFQWLLIALRIKTTILCGPCVVCPLLPFQPHFLLWIPWSLAHLLSGLSLVPWIHYVFISHTQVPLYLMFLLFGTLSPALLHFDSVISFFFYCDFDLIIAFFRRPFLDTFPFYVFSEHYNLSFVLFFFNRILNCPSH